MMVRTNLTMWRSTAAFVALCGICFADAPASPNNLDDLLARTNTQVTGFLDQFSEVKCTEQVDQEKIGKDGKVELKEESTYDYLVILTNPGGELSLDESRLPVHEAKQDKKNRPLLVSNGFATLFLVFHPYYAQSFKFALLPDETLDGRRFSKISFEHIPGTRSPAALALRGREYPLELSGSAWIDPQTLARARMRPGKPAPEPRSMARSQVWWISGASWRQSAIWRSESSGSSRGAMRLTVRFQRSSSAEDPFECRERFT